VVVSPRRLWGLQWSSGCRSLATTHAVVETFRALSRPLICAAGLCGRADHPRAIWSGGRGRSNHRCCQSRSDGGVVDREGDERLWPLLPAEPSERRTDGAGTPKPGTCSSASWSSAAKSNPLVCASAATDRDITRGLRACSATWVKDSSCTCSPARARGNFRPRWTPSVRRRPPRL
jgi:hypothetical protein